MKELCNRQALDKATLVKKNRYKTTKEPTKLVGSFVSSLAVPTGLGFSTRNYFGAQMHSPSSSLTFASAYSKIKKNLVA